MHYEPTPLAEGVKVMIQNPNLPREGGKVMHNEVAPLAEGHEVMAQGQKSVKKMGKLLLVTQEVVA